MNYTALDAFGPSYGNLKKIKVFQNDFNEDIESKESTESKHCFWKCYNLTQNHANFASWGCFGIHKISSWRWPQIYLRCIQGCVIHTKTRVQFLLTPTVIWKWNYLSLVSTNNLTVPLNRRGARQQLQDKPIINFAIKYDLIMASFTSHWM